MVTTSVRPFTVDGVRLDTLAWNVTAYTKGMAARRSADAEVPGLDGVIPSLNDTLEPANFGLEMFVRGTDADGLVPAKGNLTAFRDNLDELVHLFGKRHALLELRQQTGDQSEAINFLTNPSLETNLAGWTQGANTTMARYTTDAAVGTASLQVTATSTGNCGAFTSNQENGYPVTPGVPMKVEIRVKAGVTPRACNLNVYWYDSTGTQITFQTAISSPASAQSTTTWTTFGTTITPPDGAAFGAIYPLFMANAPGDWHLVDAAMVTMDLAASYFDGSTAPDIGYVYGWQGTAHASRSYRTPKSLRRAWAKVLDTITPEQNTPGNAATFSVGMVLPYGVWEDAASQDWASGALVNGAVQTITTLEGATERITDAIVLVKGPVTNPRVTDPNTGAYVQLSGALSSTSYWRVNVGTWATRTGTAVNSLDVADTVGADAQATTTYGGTRNQASFLPIVPVRLAGTRVCQLVLTGTGITTATRLSVRARRKYAL